MKKTVQPHDQVKMDYDGRTLLGDVRLVIGDGDRLYVTHFNGEPWPIQPLMSDVQVFSRDFPAPKEDPRDPHFANILRQMVKVTGKKKVLNFVRSL